MSDIPIRLNSWPRLSLSPGIRHPRHCQRCAAEWDLQWWQECDDFDVPENIMVILCEECAEKVIPKHPRLYRELDKNRPVPGAMVICHDCKWRDGLNCKSPRAGFNGGAGIKITHSEPIRIFFSKEMGGSTDCYSSRPSDCDGFNNDEPSNGNMNIVPIGLPD